MVDSREIMAASDRRRALQALEEQIRDLTRQTQIQEDAERRAREASLPLQAQLATRYEPNEIEDVINEITTRQAANTKGQSDSESDNSKKHKKEKRS